MRKILITAVAALPLLTGGCIAKTAFDVVTLPVKAGSQAVDWATTSQSEADRNYGKRLREAEEREGRERKAYDKRCRRDPDNCGPYEGFVAQPGGNRPR
ncbi:hypothetical protein OF829_08340 [Sphingomonas sp. LB-2]|nr:hypothetical protein [Sphingomonas caeni]MCW3847248.1 hypothetical protein [Sphingomonas caeni]